MRSTQGLRASIAAVWLAGGCQCLQPVAEFEDAGSTLEDGGASNAGDGGSPSDAGTLSDAGAADSGRASFQDGGPSLSDGGPNPSDGGCDGGGCAGCGQFWQLPCSTTAPCTSGGCVDTQAGVPECIPPGFNSSTPGWVCMGATLVSCGDAGSPCCESQTCGDPGACCAGFTCVANGASCDGNDVNTPTCTLTQFGVCSNGSCGASPSGCGGLEEQCCGGENSEYCTTPGTTCIPTISGPSQVSRCELCGGIGQPCCDGNLCDNGGCCDGRFDLCVAQGDECATGTCSAGSCGGCGGLGQPACASGNLVSVFYCTAPFVIPDPGNSSAPTCIACGGVGLPCCETTIGFAGGSESVVYCGPPYACVESQCVHCGDMGEPCCQGEFCEGSLTCTINCPPGFPRCG
jgi:hypothetical protein